MTTEIDARAIESLIIRHEQVRAYFEERQEISLRDYSDSEFSKTLVVSTASFFEQQITDAVGRLAASTNSASVESLIQIKAIRRQYHTYFQWDGSNANQFLGLFGADFKKEVADEINKSDALKDGCKSFLWLGQERNRLVHGNFVSAPVDNTPSEIETSYRKALSFVAYLVERIQPPKLN